MTRHEATRPNPRWADKNALRAELNQLAANRHVVGAARRHVEAELAKLGREADES